MENFLTKKIFRIFRILSDTSKTSSKLSTRKKSWHISWETSIVIRKSNPQQRNKLDFPFTTTDSVWIDFVLSFHPGERESFGEEFSTDKKKKRKFIELMKCDNPPQNFTEKIFQLKVKSFDFHSFESLLQAFVGSALISFYWVELDYKISWTLQHFFLSLSSLQATRKTEQNSPAAAPTRDRTKSEEKHKRYEIVKSIPNVTNSFETLNLWIYTCFPFC